MNKVVFPVLFILIITGLTAYPQSSDNKQSSIISKGAALTKAGSGYSFTEGPAVDPYGNVFFTDQPNDKILKWSEDGSISVYMEGAGRSNGLYFDNDGNLLSCADLNNELWLID